ncbi:MAG: agmatinase [Clostridia bacterium]
MTDSGGQWAKNATTQRSEEKDFAEIKTMLRLPYARGIEELGRADFAVVGLPLDTGVTHRPGARFGPAAMRDVSCLIRPYNPVLGLAFPDYLKGYDLGDVPVVPGNTYANLDRMAARLTEVTRRGVMPVGVGGDHTVSLAALRAVAGENGPVALLHFDSHPDTWDTLYGEKYNHATPFRRAIEEDLILPERSIQLGIRGSMMDAEVLEYTRGVGIEMVTASELANLAPSRVAERIANAVGETPVYVTFDIDFLDPAFAPGTGTPEVGGPSTADALGYIRRLDLSKLVGMDCVEVSPPYDNAQITALAAATILYELLGVYALTRR